MLNREDTTLVVGLNVDVMAQNRLGTNFMTKCVDHDILFTGMVANLVIVIAKKFGPSSLSHVEIFLAEYMLKSNMVSENHTLGTVKVVSPDFQGEDDGTKFKIISCIINLMNLDLP